MKQVLSSSMESIPYLRWKKKIPVEVVSREKNLSEVVEKIKIPSEALGRESVTMILIKLLEQLKEKIADC